MKTYQSPKKQFLNVDNGLSVSEKLSASLYGNTKPYFSNFEPELYSPSAIRKGYPYKLVETLGASGINRKEFISITKIPSATLDRRKKSGRLNPVESDKVYRLVTILEAATRLFDGNSKKALSWCRKPARGLGDQAPIEFADTTAGQDMVMDYIGRIEHGIAT